MESRKISFAPEDMVEGGGLLNNVDVTWKDPRFVLWDYDGKIPIPVTALSVSLVDLDGKEHPQYWSTGGGWKPNDQGTSIIPVSGSGMVNVSSNFGVLMASLQRAGVPAGKLKEGDITIFDGMECHMEREPSPKRSVVKAPRADGKVFEDTILTVSTIIKLPWEKGKGKASGAAPKGGSAAKAAPVGEVEDVEGEAVMAVFEALEKHPEGITRQMLAAEVYNAKKKDPNRQAIVNLIYNDAFLADKPWSYEGGTVKALG